MRMEFVGRRQDMRGYFRRLWKSLRRELGNSRDYKGLVVLRLNGLQKEHSRSRCDDEYFGRKEVEGGKAEVGRL